MLLKESAESLIVDVEVYSSATNLFLGEFYRQHLVVGKGHLMEHDDVPVAVSEGFRLVQDHGRSEFNDL